MFVSGCKWILVIWESSRLTTSLRLSPGDWTLDSSDTEWTLSLSSSVWHRFTRTGITPESGSCRRHPRQSQSKSWSTFGRPLNLHLHPRDYLASFSLWPDLFGLFAQTNIWPMVRTPLKERHACMETGPTTSITGWMNRTSRHIILDSRRDNLYSLWVNCRN